MKKINKAITILTLVSLLFFQLPASALADDITIPTPPPAPTAPSAPTPPIAPTAPPIATPPVSNITPPPAPTAPPAASPRPTKAPVINNNQTGTDSTITTGDANNSANVVTNSNNNIATVSNTGNGSDSTNNSSASVLDSNNVNQNNSAVIGNNVNQTSSTGNNSTSRNTGGDSNIKTGNANTSGTILTSVNTNVDGVTVHEFNVNDNQNGDIILDFNNSNCTVGCDGSGSKNNTKLATSDTKNTFQNNDATVGNNLTLAANSGKNTASHNTDGNSNITTGNANVDANVLTFANNNLDGNVIYGVVNIYGNLNGDIILPNSAVSASNSNNGAGSNNNTNITKENASATSEVNNANINNNLNYDASSGDNKASYNTNGDSKVKTGNTSVDAQTLNVANTNVDGGTWWLVLVNDAGKWIGKIVGGNGSNEAGSTGTQFTADANGNITATNSGNGSDSNNNTNVTNSTNNSTSQTNNANVTNNINLTANTGGNNASHNTGGDSNVSTGDASIVANLVNFVNNNITGGGKLVVTVVNVFGSWLGNFVTPSQTDNQSVAANPQMGGGNSNQNNSNSSSPSSPSNPVVVPPVVTVAANFPINSKALVAALKINKPELPKVLGASTTSNTSKVKSSVKINLAWVLIAAIILTPILIILKLRKNRV